MKLAVISSSPFVDQDNEYFAYSPYVRELDIWARHSDEIAFFCPIWKTDKGLLISKIDFPIAKMFVAKEFNIKTVPDCIRAFRYSFRNFYLIFRAMRWADHIHLRCPGNIGLMGCIAQIFFPRKRKTAKYAGNWDPQSKQPWSYKLQRWILSNTFLTRNMQVLVYGEWENSSKNIKPFFTASYKESDKTPVEPRRFSKPISIVYVGTLVAGKRPLYAIRLVEALQQEGIDVTLSLYGHGKQKAEIEAYIQKNNLQDVVFLKGNQPQEIVKKAFTDNHFVILPSESEGWPKVIAEGMFWGCVPIASKVSCLENMLDHGTRGLLLTMNFAQDVAMIKSVLANEAAYVIKAKNSIEWSRKYTLDRFENEIKDLLKT